MAEERQTYQVLDIKTYEEKSKGKEIVYTFKNKAKSDKYEYTVHLQYMQLFILFAIQLNLQFYSFINKYLKNGFTHVVFCEIDYKINEETLFAPQNIPHKHEYL